MNNFNGGQIARGADTDIGMRNFLLGTYKYMIAAMSLSAAVAWAFGQYVLKTPDGGMSEIGRLLFSPGAALGMTIGIVVLFGAVGAKLPSMSVNSVKVFLFGFAAVMGVWLSAIAAFVDPMVSVKIFLMAAIAFGAVSFLGYTTKRDLNPFIKFFFMVFAGFIGISLLGMFIPSLAPTGGIGIIFNIVGLIAICGITAWETQTLKRTYHATLHDSEMAEKMSVYGAASLLLSFINIFSILMNLFGSD